MKIGVLDSSNYRDYPFSGVLSIQSDIISKWPIGPDLDVQLVGITSDTDLQRPPYYVQMGQYCLPLLSLARIPSARNLPVRAQFVAAMLRGRRIIYDVDPDVWWVSTCEGVTLLSLIGNRKPVVLHCHGTVLTGGMKFSKFAYARFGPLSAAYDWSVRRALQTADQIIVNSDQAGFKQMLATQIDATPEKTRRIPAGVDTDLFRPSDRAAARQRLGLPPDAQVVAFSGRLELLKGVDLVIRAFAQQRTPSARLLIIGDGTHAPALRQLCAELGVSERVSFIGYVARDSLPVTLAAANVWASGTFFEAVSMAMLEALACGLPVVSTATNSTGELIRDGWNGFSVTDRDPAAMAARLDGALALAATMAPRCVETASAYATRKLALDVLDVLAYAAGQTADAERVGQ